MVDSQAEGQMQPVAGNDPAAGGETAATEETSQLRSELEEARQTLAQQRDQMLRVMAEADNVRKRAARDIDQAHKFALEKFVQELLPALDGLELAAGSAGRADAASLAAGQEATLKLLTKALEKFAVVVLDPLGEAFDPQRHEAMAMQPSATAEPHTVLQVVQRGYELNGRLLRPARVIVARAPDAAST